MDEEKTYTRVEMLGSKSIDLLKDSINITLSIIEKKKGFELIDIKYSAYSDKSEAMIIYKYC